MPNPYSTPESDLHRDLNHGQGDITSPFSVKGRFSRYSFLAWNLILNIAILLVVIVVMGVTGGVANFLTVQDPNAVMAFYTSGAGLILLAILFISFIVTIIFFIRRLHDINMSGWWALLIVLPIVNLIFGLFVLVKKGTEGPNSYGPTRATPTWEKVLGIISLIIIVLYFVVIIAAIAMPLIVGGMQ
jgi:uncharacterized membrane protein YhaH (DUF805 family)